VEIAGEFEPQEEGKDEMEISSVAREFSLTFSMGI
jgi:hypothetical protein